MDKDYYEYDEKPLKFLWDSKKEILPNYMWKMWVLIGALLILGIIFNVVNINSLEVVEHIDLAVSGLSFTLIIVSAVSEIYNKNEMVLLLEKPGDKKGLAVLETLTPYIFTALIYLIIGLVSVISPLLEIEVPRIIFLTLNYAFIMLLILGLFSLFNITYFLLNSLYYSVIRYKLVKELKEYTENSIEELIKEKTNSTEKEKELIDKKINKLKNKLKKMN